MLRLGEQRLSHCTLSVGYFCQGLSVWDDLECLDYAVDRVSTILLKHYIYTQHKSVLEKSFASCYTHLLLKLVILKMGNSHLLILCLVILSNWQFAKTQNESKYIS